MSDTPRETRRERLAIALSAVLIVLGVAFVYGGVARHGFVNFDDDQYVYDNPHVLAGLSGPSVRWAFVGPHSSNWHPLTTLSHLADVELFGLDAGKHHLTSVALHALSAVVLLLALRRLRGAWAPSAFVAALFALHPLRVESVAWASERKDVLSGLFWMLTLWAYAGYARRPSLARYLGVTLALVAGLMAKPMVVTLPFVLLLLDVWPLGRLRGTRPADPRSACEPHGWRALVGEKLPWFLASALAALITWSVQSGTGTVRTLEALPLDLRLAGALQGYGLYLLKTVWPAGLAFFYPHPGIVERDSFSLVAPGVLLATAVLVLLSVAAFALRRRHPVLLVGWLWFVGTLVPVIGLVQVGEQALADRYAYVPLIGIYLALAFGLRAALAARPGARPALALVAVVVLGACALVARRQVATWRDELTLYRHALAVTSLNYMAHNNLGLALSDAGELDAAVQQLDRSLAIRPGDVKASINLGITLARRGELDAARRRLEALAAAHPDFAPGHSNLASVLARQGRLDAAREHYERALALRPDLAGAHANLGVLHLQAGRPAEALDSLTNALRLRPDHGAARLNRAQALALLGRHDEARAELRELLAREPRNAAAAELLTRLQTAGSREGS